MLKVALVHFCFEDYTIQLANSLANWVDLTLIHPQQVAPKCQGALTSQINRFEFNKFRVRDLRNFRSMKTLVDFIQNLDPDILHVQETNDPWYDLTLLLNASSLPPLITTLHDIFPHPGDRERAFGSEYTKRFCFNRSQKIIVHAQSLKEILIKKFAIDPLKIHQLPHGELGSLYRHRVPSAFCEKRDSSTLLFFGRIWPYKGLKYLIEAMPMIINKIPTVKLIIAGRGENLQQYFPHEIDPQHYEIINDFIPDAQVIELFQKSTLTILPYIEASQSGVAALSYGFDTPIIASDVGGLSEIVCHDQDGILVPPRHPQALADAIIKILENPLKLTQMQRAAQSRCQTDLNWSNIAQQTVMVYEQALQKN